MDAAAVGIRPGIRLASLAKRCGARVRIVLSAARPYILCIAQY
jgi:hypothetical protein